MLINQEAVNTRYALLRESIANEILLLKIIEEKQMLADLVYKLVGTNHITEFLDNRFYVDSDNKILYPSISQHYAKDGKTATIITPSIKDNLKIDKLSVINTSEDKPLGEYSSIMTQSMIKKINEAECFVVSKDIPQMDKFFKAAAGMGVPCVYAVNGVLNKYTTENDRKVTAFMDSLAENNKLEVKKDFYYNPKNNTLGKAYVLKRR